MSDSRLAAEAAFSAPPSPAPTSIQAQVTVRKARIAVFAAEPAAADEAMATVEPASRGPRVFRVEAARVMEPGQPPSLAHSMPATAASAGPEAVAAVPRSGRVAADKRPGPVLHVVHALPAPAPAPVEAIRPGLDALITELAEVGPVLDAIRRAQSLEIVDHRMAEEWQRLALVAEDIRRDLEACLR